MRAITLILAVALMIPLMIGNLHCDDGQEPETVIVPVGEAGDGDPYNDASCEDGSAAVEMGMTGPEQPEGENMVLLTFVGTQDTWRLAVSLDEYRAAMRVLRESWRPAQVEPIGPDEVDGLMQDLCAPMNAQRTAEGRRLYEILKSVFGDRLEELASGVCM